MWPFKRKADPPFHSPPILLNPQSIPPLSAIEHRAVGVINESPEITAALVQICPDTIVAYFEGIGTAVADVAISGDEDNIVYWHTWLEHDKHGVDQNLAATAFAQSLGRGVTAEITIPTSMVEVLYQGFVCSINDFDDVIVKPTASFSDDAIQSMLDNLSNLPSMRVGIGTRVQTPQGIRSPLSYNATGSEPSRAAIRKLNWDCFKMWLKDPWGRYRNANPARAKITRI